MVRLHPIPALIVALLLLLPFSHPWRPSTVSTAASPVSPHVSPSPVGPKAYYLALGDSLAYGDQPNGQYYHGYADDLYSAFAMSGTGHLIDMGCPHETTTTFVTGGCPYASTVKNPYNGAQLNAALTLIGQHPGQVSPVTLDLGTDEIRTLFDLNSCTLASTQTVAQALSTFDANLTSILSQLHTALHGTGDLLMMDNFFAHQNQCPNLVSLIQTFNQHLTADARQGGATVAPVFNAFGGATIPNPNLCTLTWICSSYGDIHPTDQGYQLIAQTFAVAAGYPPLPPSPTPGMANSGTYSGSLSSVGATSSITITPASRGTARVGLCATSTGDTDDLFVYGKGGALLASGTAASNCQWVKLGVSAGQPYTVTAMSAGGTGSFRVAWDVNQTPVVWNVGGAISTAGGTQTASFLTLSGAPLSLSSCGPADSNFDLELLAANGAILASSTSPSNCEALTYTPSGPALFRLQELDVHGGGSWLGTITTEMATPPPSPTPTPAPSPTPVPSGAEAGTHSGHLPGYAATDSYSFVPATSGSAIVGSCGISTADNYHLHVYDDASQVGDGTAGSNCQWAELAVSASDVYTVTTKDISGTQDYRSAWSVNGAPVTWTVTGSIGAAGGASVFSFLTLDSGTISASSCGPPGSHLDLYLTNTGTTVLASSTAPSNCQSLLDTPRARGLFRLKVVSVSGTGPYTATVTS